MEMNVKCVLLCMMSGKIVTSILNVHMFSEAVAVQLLMDSDGETPSVLQPLH